MSKNTRWSKPKSIREATRREERDTFHFSRLSRNTSSDYNAREFHYGSDRRIKEVVLLEAFRHQCFYCGKTLTFDTATRDHLIPKRAGGKNIITNLVLCCYVCNQMKWDDVATEDEIDRAFQVHIAYRKDQLLKDQEMHRKHVKELAK